jgi:serine/threonine protein kinase
VGNKLIPDSIPWTATGDALGEGGQARIYDVKPKEGSGFTPGKYAMKILGRNKPDQAKQRFIQEIETIRQIDDSRIVKIINHCNEEDDFYYYVMPNYMEDGYEVIQKLAFAPDYHFREKPHKCLQLIIDCAEALAKVNDMGISHRDINPKNILYNPETGKPLIIDFGICHIIGNENITMTDEAVGTRYYMAPECERGQACEKDLLFLADIYSLGKLLWALVTGRDSFAREKPAFTTHNMTKMFPNNSECWHLNRIFEKTIRSDPKNRHIKSAELAEMCRNVMSNINLYPPLELLSTCCPACGGLLDNIPKYFEQNLASIYRDHRRMKQLGYDILECGTCGFLCTWNKTILNKRKEELENIE